RPRGLASLFALPGALSAVDPRLATPPGVATNRLLAARWAVHRAQTAELLGDAVIDALAARLRRHLRPSPRDPSARDPSVIVALPELDAVGRAGA
ncbi:MAG TPA: hypothetical protein VHW23_03680, partial [Kofleriaceae bacterium]|nr:hypothetical protein [Kofleriaceae bacterium]